MTKAEDDRRDMALRVMFETLSTSAPTPAQVLGYRMSLDDIPLDELEKAIRLAMRTSRAVPRPAEIRDLAGRGQNSRPYHRPYRVESVDEKKRILASWEPQRLALAAASSTGNGDAQ